MPIIPLHLYRLHLRPTPPRHLVQLGEAVPDFPDLADEGAEAMDYDMPTQEEAAVAAGGAVGGRWQQCLLTDWHAWRHACPRVCHAMSTADACA